MTVIIFTAIILWVYKCIVVREEGKHKNVMTLGRFSRTISGTADRVYDKATKRLIPAQTPNHQTLGWIWFGIQWVSSYRLPWKEPKKSSDVTPGDKHIISGNPEKDVEVSYYRYEKTNHHRDQHDYRFDVFSMETGEKKKKGIKDKNPENVTVDLFLQGTVKMDSPYAAEFRNSAYWHPSVEATIKSALSEIVSTLTYVDLPKIRGEKLETYLVKNTEPETPSRLATQNSPLQFFFSDSTGKRKKKITFLERINYEILIVKQLGVFLINIPLLDYEISEESIEYIKALEEKAVSEVRLETSQNKGNALRAEMQPRIDGAVSLINADRDATIAKKKEPDVTIIQRAQHMQNLRVLVESNSGQNMPSSIDIANLVNTAVGLDLAHEINQGKSTTKKGGNP